MSRRVFISTIIAMSLFPAVITLAQDDSPVLIEKYVIHVARVARSRSRIYKEPGKIEADIKNIDPSRRIKEVEFQFDVIDKMRRVTKERLFITITDYGLGDRTIEPGKTRKWTADIGDAEFPDGCETMGAIFSWDSA